MPRNDGVFTALDAHEFLDVLPIRVIQVRDPYLMS
jgi:hypothetical protein